MKLKLAFATLFLLLLFCVGSASASRYYLPYQLARHETRNFAIEDCEEDPDCIAYGVGSCARRTLSRIDCVEATFFLAEETGGELECDATLHWGVNYRGVITLKSLGRPYCYYV